MDISDDVKGPIGENESRKNDFESKASELGEKTIEDDNGRCSKNLKRSLDKDFMNSKKRRKQLKPIRIATNLEDMVKVPKQIIGLINDLDNVNDLSHTVPKVHSSKSQNSPVLNDVHFLNPLQSEISAGQTSNNLNNAIDKLETTNLNVPNIDMGPNLITNPHFIFPLPFQPVKNPNFWSEVNLKIFNQEAYCELCKKEFCNKYFLKTHKANKHGIYVDFPTASTTKTFIKNEAQDACKISENEKTSSESDCTPAFCDLCNKKFCNKYFVRRHKSKSHGLMEEDTHLPGFPCEEPESKIVQNSPNNSTKETNSTLMSQQPLALVSKEIDFDQDNQKKDKANEDQEGPLNLIMSMKEESDDGDAQKNERKEKILEQYDKDEDECSSENIEKLQTMLLRLNPSEIENKICRICNETFESYKEHKCIFDKKEKDYLSEINDSSSESKNDFGITKSDNQDFLYASRLDHLKHMKPTSSYCEICNKELCNKYFMRTHMQRMHGIEIEHGTQIGGVVCNICNKELCSKYFLRVHKQNTHGIISPNTLLGPSTSGSTHIQRNDVKTSRADTKFVSNLSQVCYICSKRFRSQKWLQAHFLSDHREGNAKIDLKETEEIGHKKEDSNQTLKIPQKNQGLSMELNDSSEAIDVISKIFWENNSTSKTYNCSQCPFSTSVLAFLFVHERSHFFLTQEQSEIVKPSVALQNLIHDKTFWQHKITQQMPECLDLSAAKTYVTFEQNGS